METPNLVEGTKLDSEKTRYDLIPENALEQVAKVATYGAKKYADRNWEKGIKYSRIFAAMMRHAWAWFRGENYDPETGLHHLAHAAWCALALVEYDCRMKLKFTHKVYTHLNYLPFDDRPCFPPMQTDFEKPSK